jgi:FtsH-binding integral membrane protein
MSEFVAEIVLALFSVVWLYLALRPEQFVRHLLDERSRSRVRFPEDSKSLSRLGWVLFILLMGLAVVSTVLRLLHTTVDVNQNKLDAFIFLCFTVVYALSGTYLFKRPDKYRERIPEVPEWAVRVFGIALLLLATFSLYMCILRIHTLLR